MRWFARKYNGVPTGSAAQQQYVLYQAEQRNELGTETDATSTALESAANREVRNGVKRAHHKKVVREAVAA
jgi:hypothetical protein